MTSEIKILNELMTMDQLESALRDQAVRIITMKINDWYVKGQKAVLVAHTTLCEPEVQEKMAVYECIESGKQNSLWRCVCA